MEFEMNSIVLSMAARHRPPRRVNPLEAADPVNKVINHLLSRHTNCKLTGRKSYSVIDTVTP